MTDFHGFASRLVPQFSSRYSPIVEELLRWQVRDDPNFKPADAPFYEKAVKALIRKLKRGKEKGSQVEKLVRTIQNKNGDLGCIVIPRSLDGRMQVCNKKVLPHVLYCSIWRWPDVRNHHELRHKPGCEYSHSLKKDQICINPYHYERMRAQAVPPVLVPRLPPNQIPDKFLAFESIPLLQEDYEDQDWVVASNVTLGEQNRPLNSPNGYLSECSETLSAPQSPMSSSSVGTATSVIIENTNFIQNSLSNISLSTEKPSSMASSSPSSDKSSVNMDNNENQETYVKQEPERDYSENKNEDNSTAVVELIRTEVSFEEAPTWCTVHYYEMNKRFGEPFEGKAPIIKIDGWTDPSDGNRLCLGVISNVNRSREIELVRRNIGNGVELVYDMGKVSIRNMSDGSVFIQSPHMNEMWNMDHKTVVKIPAGHEADIFDNQRFATRLGYSVEYGFEAVYRLNRMCTLRLSFVKGWGSDYRRAHVTSTPCWTEIHLNGPLQWLDRVLREMGGPNKNMTSFS